MIGKSEVFLQTVLVVTLLFGGDMSLPKKLIASVDSLV